MKNNILFSFLITVLLVGSALFARNFADKRRSEEAVQAMAYGSEKQSGAEITFTDLAFKVNSVFNGEVAD